MKTISRNPASFFPSGPGEHPDSYLVEPLLYLLAALLLGAALWHVVTLTDETAATLVAPARLELILSGALTDTLSSGERDFKTLRCGPSGFALETSNGAALPLKLTFSSIAAQSSGGYQVLGSNSDSDLTLQLGGTPYTLLSGSVTSSAGLYTFNAFLVDAQSQPLFISGRLNCPSIRPNFVRRFRD